MLSRNFSIKATVVFSGILAMGLVAPSAIAQVEPVLEPTTFLEFSDALAPILDAPALDALAADEPVADELTTNELTTNELTTNELTTDEPAAGEPGADSETAMLELLAVLDTVPPAIETPVAEVPVAEIPVAEVPVAETPVAEVPAAEAPVAVTDNPGAASLVDLQAVSLSPAIAPDASHLDISNLNAVDASETSSETSATALLAAQSSAIPALTSALNSDNMLTRLYAADALWNLTGNRELILPTLTAAASSRDIHVRDLAVTALAQLGAQALPSVSVLHEAALNERASNSRTRRIAQDTLAVVRGDRRPATVLGIIARESRRMLIPPAIRALSGLWR
ncbi:MAG: HEAT repeat domain-containing protein [Phormidesmis sp.]